MSTHVYILYLHNVESNEAYSWLICTNDKVLAIVDGKCDLKTTKPKYRSNTLKKVRHTLCLIV